MPAFAIINNNERILEPMKKRNFSLLILLVLCVTIAGAYATWNYVAGKNIGELNESILVNLAEDSVKTADGGTLSATGSISALIDDGGEYKPEFVASGDGITVTYDATDSNTPDITKINMQATITIESVAKYNNAEIFTLKKTMLYSEVTDSWTITPAMIEECIQMADFTLPTPTDYNALETAMQETQTKLTITIGAVPPAENTNP